MKKTPTVHKLFADAAQVYQEKPAVEFLGETLTYRELDEWSNGLAHQIRELGIAPGSVVAVAVDRGFGMCAALLAILKAGCCYVPIDPLYPRERIRIMLEDCKPQLLLSDGSVPFESALVPKYLELSLDRHSMANSQMNSLLRQDIECESESLMYIIYTSGSTGKPKGVQVPHRAIVNLLNSMMQQPGLAPGSRVLATTTISFDVHVPDLFWPWMVGGTAVVTTAQEAMMGEKIASYLESIDFFQCTPTLWKLIIESGWKGNKKLRMMSTGEPLPLTLAKQLLMLGSELWNGYGPTETTYCHFAQVHPQDRIVKIGKPVKGNIAYVVDEIGNQLPQGLVGELWLAGPGVAKGYLGNTDHPKFFKDPFGSQWQVFATGDLVVQNMDGEFTCLGRKDDQVKVRGFRIELGEVEAVLATLPQIQECIVDVRTTAQGDAALYAWVVTKEANLETLRAAARQLLPAHMVPNFWFKIDELPRTPSGKRDRKKLSVAGLVSDTHATRRTQANTTFDIPGIVQKVWEHILQSSAISAESHFFNQGGNSLLALRESVALEEQLGIQISPVLLFQHPIFADYCAAVSDALNSAKNGANTPPLPSQTVNAAGREILHNSSEKIAIVGWSGVFPSGVTTDTLWDTLLAGKDLVTTFSSAELAWALKGKSVEGRAKGRGILDDATAFDPEFFGMNRAEATLLDPQQRLFITQAWGALEEAGLWPMAQQKRTGVFGGVSQSTYALLPEFRKMQEVDPFAAMVSSDKDYVATRAAYQLNLTGQAVTVQTACSTSLVALHLAVQALRRREIDIAVAGGASVTLPTFSAPIYIEGGMHSPDGKTRSFDAKAQGTSFCDGAAALALMRLEDALAQGCHIWAVVSGSAVNNDGRVKASLSAPSSAGQAAVIAAAQQDAGISPTQVGLIEAHGTATPLGDPIEFEAISNILGQNVPKDFRCAVTSIKGTTGHLTAAAGVAGVIRAALSLYHQIIPPQPHFRNWNPYIASKAHGLFVPETAVPFNEVTGKYAAVSSFGVGGTNAHCILERAPLQRLSADHPPEDKKTNSDAHRLFVVSAQSRDSLLQFSDTWKSWNWSSSLPQSVASSLARGRSHHSWRSFAVCETAAQASEHWRRNVSEATFETVAFLFPGQGSHFQNMGLKLAARFPEISLRLKRCHDILWENCGFDLMDCLSSSAKLKFTQFAQPALVSLQWALGDFLISQASIKPAALVGHSIGELSAMCLAQACSLEEMLWLATRRGELMAECAPGAMLAVRSNQESIVELLSEYELDIAATNSPLTTVVSGQTSSVLRLEKSLESKGIAYKRLETSHAFHSRMMNPILERFETLASKINWKLPEIPIISCMTQRIHTRATDGGYWAQHLSQPVLFRQAIESFEKPTAFIEIGPGHSLSRFAAAVAQKTKKHFACLPCCTQGNEVKDLLNVVGFAFQNRWNVNLDSVLEEANWTRLPKHPLNQQSLTIEKKEVPAMPTLLSILKAMGEDLSGETLPENFRDVSFLNLGLDSLALTQMSIRIKNLFGVTIRFRDLMESAPTFGALADRLIQEGVSSGEEASQLLSSESAEKLHVPKEPTHPPKDANDFSKAASSNAVFVTGDHVDLSNATELTRVIGAQIQLLHAQLALLRGSGSIAQQEVVQSPEIPAQKESKHNVSKENVLAPKIANQNSFAPLNKGEFYDAKKAFGAAARITLRDDSLWSPSQRTAFESFMTRYTKKTAKSKLRTQQTRGTLADPRVVTGFKPHLKELIYQPIVERSHGPFLYDIDGNKYIDALNGFGINYFGWGVEFIAEAVKEAVSNHSEIGPMTPLAHDVAALVCKLTGVERVGFCNTGSEAVLGALRIARTVTGRDKIIYFSGSYHGINDEVIARPGKNGRAFPAAPGILANTAENVLILDYGTPESLEVCRALKSEIAAILVEPIQSRRPDLQPKEFLKELRKICTDGGCALIFDEVITGFRLAQGGAQAYFDVEADIVTYGKVAGGGLPLGLVAGKSKWLDALDGGFWSFGDSSVPEVGVTYFAGTFVRFPPALAAAKAVLSKMAAEGPSLQENLNRKTELFCSDLNKFCRSVSLPLTFKNMGSLWRATFDSEQPFGDLMFIWLRYHGLHIWDGFPCFLTLAHTDEVIANMKEIFQKTVIEMQQAELLPGKPIEAAQQNKQQLNENANLVLGKNAKGEPCWFEEDPVTGHFREIPYNS